MISTHLVSYCGKMLETTVTHKAAIAEDWLKKNINKLWLEQNPKDKIVAIDCKYIHHPINSMSNKVATLQICIGTKCLMLQLRNMDFISKFIKDFLCDSSITFVGVEIKENSKKLLDEYEINLSTRKFDLRVLAKAWFPISCRGMPSLKVLAYGISGLSMRPKSGKNYEGDCESRFLDEELIEQACVDAYACYSIAHKMLKGDV